MTKRTMCGKCGIPVKKELACEIVIARPNDIDPVEEILGQGSSMDVWEAYLCTDCADDIEHFASNPM